MDVLFPLASVVIGAVIGAVATTIGQYFLVKRKERKERGKFVECVRLVSERRSKDSVFGPMAGRVQVKIPKEGPGSDLVDIEEWYYLKFRFRNLSDSPVPEIRLRFNKSPVWFDITQGGQDNPDWEAELKRLLKEKGEASKQGYTCSIPYINPYLSTKHEVFLELASYVPLSDVKVSGGAKGVYFSPCRKIKTRKIPKIRLFFLSLVRKW